MSAFSLKLRGEGEVDRWCVGLVLGKRAEEHLVPGVCISEGLDLLRDRGQGSPCNIVKKIRIEKGAGRQANRLKA